MTSLRSQQNLTSDSPYYSQHDQAIAKRLQDLQGYGEPIYYNDDEFDAGILQDLGLDMQDPTKG